MKKIIHSGTFCGSHCCTFFCFCEYCATNRTTCKYNWKKQKAFGLMCVLLRNFNAGHLQDAVNIPHDKIVEGIKAIGSDKDAPINLYCRSGRRAEATLTELKNAGYTNVTNHGGYEDLVKKGLK